MLNQQDLFTKALKVEKPWYINDIQFDQQVGKLEIWIDLEQGSTFYYEDKELGISGHFQVYDMIEKSWRHLNFFQYHCYLHARIPRINLDNENIRQVRAPWEGHTSGFTLLFEALMAELVKVMPIHQVSKVMKTYGKKIWNMEQRDKCNVQGAKCKLLHLTPYTLHFTFSAPVQLPRLLFASSPSFSSGHPAPST
jgi:transposase